MSFKPLVSVGSYDFPEPASYSSNTATIVDSGRNLEGVVIGSVIRDDVAKIQIGWRYLTLEQWAEINNCFNIKKGGKFYNSVTFLNQATGEWETREMYVSDRKAGIWRRDEEGNVKGWVECKLSLIEV